MNKWTNYHHARKIIPWLTLLAILLGCQEVPPNVPPEITEIMTYPAQPKAGQEVILTAFASDEDGDIITYKWKASGGVFLDTLGSNPISWRAPADTGTINVFVEASDQDATTSGTYQFPLESGVGSVAGHVTDLSTGSMLSGVVVNMNGVEFTTGSDGYYFFSEVLAGENIPISAVADNYATFAQLIHVGVEENIFDIPMTTLSEVGRIAGYVSDAISGVKLEGVLVETGTIQATTGAEGFYELNNVPISQNILVRATMNGYYIHSGLFNVVAGYNNNNISLQPNLATVSGRVTAASDGSMLQGAIVTLNQYADTTNAAGFFELLNVPVSSNASISASLEGYYPNYMILDIGGGINNVDLQLGQNAGNLSGWIRSSLDGSIIPNASIQIGTTVVNSQSDGSYLVSELGLGTRLITCSAENFTNYTTLLDIEAGSNSLDIDLSPSIGSISGYLRDALTDSSLSQRTITLGALSTLTAADGYFTFQDISVGQHLLTVAIADYQIYTEVIQLEPGLANYDISLTPSHGIVLGIVRNLVSGTVMQGAIVGIGSVRDTTDAQGYYEFGSIALGSKQISCAYPNFVSTEELVVVTTGTNIHDVYLRSSVGNVLGVVRESESGTLLQNVVVQIGDSTVVSNANGQFTLSNVGLGQAEFIANLTGYLEYSDWLDVEVGTNSVSIEMTPSVGHIFGVVRDALSGARIDSAMITLDDSTTMTNSLGEFTIMNYALGQAYLEIIQDNYTSYSEWLDVGTGNNAITIDMNPAFGQVEGFITDAETFTPLDSVQVILGSDTTLTNSNGYYGFEDVPVDPQVSLQAQKFGYTQHVELIVVSGGENSVNIQMTPSVGHIFGVVRDALSGARIDSALIMLDDSTAMTTSLGQFSIMNFALGQAYLTVSHDNYTSYSDWIDVGTGNNAITIDLFPAFGQVMGYITDAATFTPLDSVQVILGSDTTLTSSNGYYGFEDVPVDPHVSLEAYKVGYIQHVQWIPVVGGDNVNDIALTSEN